MISIPGIGHDNGPFVYIQFLNYGGGTSWGWASGMMSTRVAWAMVGHVDIYTLGAPLN